MSEVDPSVAGRESPDLPPVWAARLTMWSAETGETWAKSRRSAQDPGCCRAERGPDAGNVTLISHYMPAMGILRFDQAPSDLH